MGHYRRKRVATSLVFSVQDRRNRARALLQIQQRKAALFPIGTSDVAHRLHVMQPNEGIMDCSFVAEDTEEDFALFSSGNIPPEEIRSRRRTPISYEQWVEEGFPVDCWRPLLMDELYEPLEAEQTFLQAKYTLASKRRKSLAKETSTANNQTGIEKKES
ncbi:uncharacterized protein TM35_000091790 [Trypanosoma theileri]|uniref:Uncharacterized protein n=1 Tax=Trypanosoma theileri TaxID=67003 RepID=A0A1X0P0U0_9TRYP|nr:uncharacterized protein TM35_000091790 [Trypanosoma theileri]ORC90129.1 hypothetical protein TM35_000091790 [Trypanosoma theileri]